MEILGRYVFFIGMVLAAVGALIWAMGKTGLIPLPGDVVIRSPRTTFYFPIATCILVSALLTFILWLWHRLNQGEAPLLDPPCA